MQKERTDLWLFLMIVIVFSASVGFLHGGKKFKSPMQSSSHQARSLR